jgi:cytoskeletal protein CcmA (bactofilin family)
MPIDQTIRGLALEIDASTDPAPETQPLLEYRFIDLASTQTILARIKGIPQPNGGGQLAFETNAGVAATTQRMLIDNNGNVGIGTANPGAKLDVDGDAKFSGPLSVQGVLRAAGVAQIGGDLNVAGEGKFSGPLSVQGTLTTGGAARIGGDLTVTGKLTAASFTGDGAGLSHVTPADNSITSAKLSQDPASLSKITDGKMAVNGDRLDLIGHTTLNGSINVLRGLTAGSAIQNPISQIYGNLHVQGRLTAGVKTFRIDHPLDPENKYLSHSSVESPDVMNIYNGNITTDTEGNATVVLPDYFEALNRDFRYQLTVIGKRAQATVASEIENNRFTINTDQPDMKVSWQVTGIRQDASAKAFPSSVEEEKPEAERGFFLHPEHYGYSKERGIAFTCHPDRMHDRLGEPRLVPYHSAASIK